MTGRGTRACFGSAGELADPVPVPRIGPVVFSLSFGGMEKVVDLSDLARPLLVGRWLRPWPRSAGTPARSGPGARASRSG